VRCSQDPSVVKNWSTAQRTSIHFKQHDLPRPGTTRCPLTVDNDWTDIDDVWWSQTTHCKNMSAVNSTLAFSENCWNANCYIDSRWCVTEWNRCQIIEVLIRQQFVKFHKTETNCKRFLMLRFTLSVYTQWVKKKQDTKLLAITSLTIIRFFKIFY